MLKNSEIAEQAAENIRKYGWQRRQLGARKVGFCMLGAGIYALARHQHKSMVDVEPAVEDRVAVALIPGLPAGVHYPTFFNDVVAVDHQQVIDACITAAKHWRDQGE